jgi:hypothetical protein
MPAPTDRLVLSYMGEPHFHRSLESDPRRPACDPKRFPGVAAMRVRAEHHGQSPCPLCWPDSDPATRSLGPSAPRS